MRRYDIDLGRIANEAHASGLVAIDAALSGAQIAVAEVGVGQRPLLGRISRGQPKIPWRVVVEQKRRGEMKASLSCCSNSGNRWSSLKKTMPYEWGGHGAERDELHAGADMALAERCTIPGSAGRRAGEIYLIQQRFRSIEDNVQSMSTGTVVYAVGVAVCKMSRLELGVVDCT